MKENNTYQIIKNLVEKNGNKRRAALKIGCTVRNINLLIKKFKEDGKEAFSHKNKGKNPINKLSDDLVNKIINLYQEKYYDFNWCHFRDKLFSDENISLSYNCLYKTLTNNGFISPLAERKTKKNKKKELQKKLENKGKLTDIDKGLIVQNNILDYEDAHPRRPRSKYFGEMIQMDASSIIWFGTQKTHLHLAIDDASGVIVGAYIDNQETLFGYYNVFNQILNNYGIPMSFFTDRRTIFEYNKSSDKSIENDTFTQFAYACKTLGVEIKTSSVSQAKGLVERGNYSFQCRLPQELRLHGINMIEEANKFLSEFVQDFNKKFALPLNNIESVFDNQVDSETINNSLAIISKRVFDWGSSIKFKNDYYQAFKGNSIICFKNKTQCLVIETFDGKLLISVDDNVYEARKLDGNRKYSITFDNMITNQEKEKKKYIPSMNHPWKTSSFIKFVNDIKYLY